jgi:hypothetical protein
MPRDHGHLHITRLRDGHYSVVLTDSDGDRLLLEVDDQGLFIIPDQDLPNGVLIKGLLFKELMRLVLMCNHETKVTS